jgi:ADP-ribose pyrophosphatase
MSKLEPIVVLHQGRFISLVKRGRWEYAERVNATGAAVVVAVTDDGKLLLTEQFRIPLGKPVIELPAGIVGDVAGEEHEIIAVAARRELLEETGYEAREMRELFTGPTSAGLTSEQVTLFLASGLRRVSAGGGKGEEQIQVHEIPLAEVHDWLFRRVAEGVPVDPKVFAGIYFAKRA